MLLITLTVGTLTDPADLLSRPSVPAHLCLGIATPSLKFAEHTLKFNLYVQRGFSSLSLLIFKWVSSSW